MSWLVLLKPIWSFLQKIPLWVYLVLVAVVYHVISIHVAETRGKDEANATWIKKVAEERAAYDLQVAALKKVQEKVITETVIEYRDVVKVEKVKGDAIIKEVPVLVKSDCVLGGGMRVAHDAAASGVMPDDPERAAAAAAPVEAVTLATTIAENYSACRANSAQLVALQTIVSKLGAKP